MSMRCAVALLIASLPGIAFAQARPGQPGDRPISADGTVPLSDQADGPAKTSLPEQDVSPTGTSETPGSAASRDAERTKR